MPNNIGNIKEDVDLTSYNTYRINTKTKYLIEPNNKEELINLINYINDNNINYFILGNGSNVILSFDYYDGIIISLKNMNKYEFDNDKLHAEAGCMLPVISKESIERSLTGLEWAIGIPGTLGASILGNAGAYLHEIMEYVISIEVMDKQGNIKVLNKDDITYGYRTTSFKENKEYIILSATLQLEQGDKEESLALVEDRRKRRMESQPLEYPSAGSVFRNPDKEHPAGKLIEESNLKGKVIGGAKVSDKHANFIINNGNATSKDIIKLINLIKKEVKDKFDIDLLCEQEII